MNKYWISQSVIVGALLFAPQILFAREPKLADPCKEMRATLDNQVNTLHKQQNEELDQCRKTNGKDSDVCRDLKKQQELELNKARDHRQTELSGCSARLINSISTQRRNNESCGEYVQNQDNDYYHDKHHKPPYKHSPDNPDKNPPVAHNPKAPDPGARPHRDKDADNARNGGSSGSSPHNAGSSSASSGSSHGSSGSSNSGGNSGSSSHSASTSSSPNSSSSSSSSSSSNSSSSGSSSSSSNSSPSYSPPASSYSPPAPSAPSHSESGGSRPR